MTKKIYHCTHCGVEIPQKTFLVQREKIACPACGKTLVRWQMLQRQDTAKPLGDPPMGVRVRAGMMAPDKPYEDRIVYSRRKLSGILIGLWMALAFGGAGVMALIESNLLGTVLLLPGGIGLYWLLFELFGHDDLHLYAQSGAYTSGIGPWKKRVDFSLSSETYARCDEHVKGGFVNADVPILEILVTKGECEDARFGSTLPQDVMDFFTACIARRAAGHAIVSAKGPSWRPEIAHPIAFAVLAVAIVFLVAYSFSGHDTHGSLWLVGAVLLLPLALSCEAWG